MKFSNILNEHDVKGAVVSASDYPVLYHLTDFTGLIHISETGQIRSKSSNYVSTTYSNNMLRVGGRDHYHFRLVLDGAGLISQFGGNKYASYAQYTTGGRHKYDEAEIGIQTKEFPISFVKHLNLVIGVRSRSFIQWMFYGKRHSQKDINGATALKNILDRGITLRNLDGSKLSIEDLYFIEKCIELRDKTFDEALAILAHEQGVVDHTGDAITPDRLARDSHEPAIVADANKLAGEVGKADLKQAAADIAKWIKVLAPANYEELTKAVKKAGIVNHELSPIRMNGLLRCLIRDDQEEFLEMILFIKDEQDRISNAFGDDRKRGFRRTHSKTGF